VIAGCLCRRDEWRTQFCRFASVTTSVVLRQSCQWRAGLTCLVWAIGLLLALFAPHTAPTSSYSCTSSRPHVHSRGFCSFGGVYPGIFGAQIKLRQHNTCQSDAATVSTCRQNTALSTVDSQCKQNEVLALSWWRRGDIHSQSLRVSEAERVLPRYLVVLCSEHSSHSPFDRSIEPSRASERARS
jgi:hypothetical protein